MGDYSENSDVVLIGKRRFKQSPYFPCYEKPGIICGVYAGRFFPRDCGHDTSEKYWVLRRKAALYDVPEKPMEIAGPDVVPFLEKVIARRISNLKEGRGRYAIACTPQGGIFMDGILFKMSENRYWYVQPDGALETWLVAHSDGYDISVSNPESRVIQIQGPASMEIMRDASDGAIDETMGYFHSGMVGLGDQDLYVSRTGWTGELGYEIYSFGNRTNHRQLWEHLMAAGEPYGMEFSDTRSMETRRLEAGILDNTTDMDMSMTPFQAGLGQFIDMEKDDFVGRDALVDADRQTLLYGIKCNGAKPIMNDAISMNSQIVGRVTAGAWSPYLQTFIGYVRFSAPGQWTGAKLVLQTGESETHACDIVSLPFYDPEKKIPRGLESTALYT